MTSIDSFYIIICYSITFILSPFSTNHITSCLEFCVDIVSKLDPDHTPVWWWTDSVRHGTVHDHTTPRQPATAHVPGPGPRPASHVREEPRCTHPSRHIHQPCNDAGPPNRELPASASALITFSYTAKATTMAERSKTNCRADHKLPLPLPLQCNTKCV